MYTVAIPYTVHVVGGAPPVSNPTPFLELVLCGDGVCSLPITLEPLGMRPTPGTPETYSVEGSNIGNITHIKLRLVGANPGASWLINEVTIHSPTSGHTHHFPFGCDVVAGGEESVVKAAVLESSYNTSTMVSTPRASSSSSELIGG